ncbi:MAG: glycosyltransferase family 4 protein [Victivallales bacterium]|nr:glycosyltransferase family 4 protein [Victivallales bacterium]
MRLFVSCVPFDDGRSGISVYIRHVIRELAAQGHDLTLLIEPGMSHHFNGFKTIEMPSFTRRAVFSMLYHAFVVPFMISRDKYDACLITAANRRSFLFYRVPTMSVVHDLSQYHVENKYDAFRTFYIKKVLPWLIRGSKFVAAVSHATATDLERYWHVPHEKIHVAYNGLSLPETHRSGWLAAHPRLRSGHYVFYVSRLEHPGKNHVRLIQAYEGLPEKLRHDFPLVLAGADWPGSEAIHAAAEASPAKDDIVFCGFVDSADMKEAYENAACYVFPSLFEGFGLSLIEAMHYGVPCGCSNTSSLGEIGGDTSVQFDPTSVDEIRQALITLLTDEKERARLHAEGPKRAAQFNWQNHARILSETMLQSSHHEN